MFVVLAHSDSPLYNQTMPNRPFIKTRAFQTTDTQRLEEILRLNSGSRSGRSHFDAFFVTFDSDLVPNGQTLVAEVAGRVVGFGMIGQHEWHASAAMMGINVDPSFCKRGVGGALYDALLETWKHWHGLKPIRAVASDAYPDSKRFLERRGFSEESRTHLPILELTRFASSSVQGVLERLGADEIEIRSLSSLRDDLDYQDKAAYLYKTIYTSSHVANPVSDAPLEDWLWELRQFQPDGVMIALQRGEYIGFGALAETEHFSGPTGFMYGTLESHAALNLGISLAVVAAQVRYLQERQSTHLHFEIDSDDLHGMALIAALPVTPQPAFVTYVRPLELARAG